MSKIRLYGDTSGYLELDVPAVAGDRSLILPDVNGNFVFGSNTFKLPGSSGTLDSLNRAGNVLQVVNATYSTAVTNTTNVYADTGLAATITPTSASSKILVVVNQAGLSKMVGNALSGVFLRLLRGATEILFFEYAAGFNNASGDVNLSNSAACYLDSPNTTSSITYKTQFRNNVNASGVSVQNGSPNSTITLMEIAA